PGTTEPLEATLGLVYSYGSGGSDSCLNGSKAVSGLLGGVSVDHYMTFTADSIAVVNDMLGGVMVPVTEDIPGLDKGESVTLFGENAVAYFRFRDDGDVANEAHMERQRQYMTGMYGPFLEKTRQEDFLTKLTLQLGDGLSTDLTLSQMMQMLQSLETYALEETVLTVSGKAADTDGEFRFQVDAQALERTVADLFFEE
ncbi:MAG: LCP family protein, partial [Oscillospiraceae bacterium]